METLTRMVTDSLARHGFDHPPDPRRLQWSGWSRCDSPHSLLVVPSKPGIFALAEEVMNFGASQTHAAVADREGHDFSPEPALSKRSAPKGAAIPPRSSTASATGGIADGNHRAESVRRMLAVLQFAEDDDMAFVLDRMFTQANPMRARLAAGRCFLRFVVIEDQTQRRSICSALNQWLLSSAEKASGIAGFSSSLELNIAEEAGTGRVGRTLLSDSADTTRKLAPAEEAGRETDSRDLESGANKNSHCPLPVPSGF